MTSEKRPADRSEDRPGDDLEQLQQLLLGEERKRLEQLDDRVSDFESRAADVAEVLPEAFQRVAGDPVLEAEIEKPVLRTIRSSIKRDAHAFAEYLFPVMGPAIRRAVADSARALGLSFVNMPSGAGHDAQSLAPLGPIGMIFVPSVAGISHAPGEHTEAEAIVNGANVLLATLLALDGATSP